MHSLAAKLLSTCLVTSWLVAGLLLGGQPLSAQALYQADFEGKAGSAPRGWQGWGGIWTLAQDDSSVLQQTQANYRGYAQAGLAWSNYDVQVTIRPLNTGAHWGLGVVGYWQPDGSCYRLSSYGGMLALWRETKGVPQALAVLNADLKPQQVYRVRLALRSESGATVLAGKVWPVVETEPEAWQITARDELNPLRQGRAGLFTGRAAAQFYDFSVTAPDPPDEPYVYTQQSLKGPGLPPGVYWALQGGAWELPTTHQPLRQTNPGTGVGFRSAAYAIYSGFTDCTVQAGVKVPSGSRSQGCGLSAYWQSDGSGYSLGQLAGATLVLLRRTSRGSTTLAEAPFAFKKGVWYVLKLRLSNGPGGVQLQGKVWPARAGEPTQWQLQATEALPGALAGGDVALWGIDDVCSFDDLVVTPNP
jgi:hypothetical protein